MSHGPDPLLFPEHHSVFARANPLRGRNIQSRRFVGCATILVLG
ncbi:hypothetical protein Agau_C200831 [Agrobacterium tumefaciens F2]|nr:hypothetical protein Agau_C200831 [Agrobacterium tumefaciens F2]